MVDEGTRGEPPERSSLRALVVDDSAIIRNLVAAALDDGGFEVRLAADVGEARGHLAAGRPDVVVLDVELPDASGFELLAEIVASAGPPVLMLTGRSSETDRMTGLELGAADYITKPFFPRELTLRAVRAACAHPPAPAPPTSRLEHGDLVIDLAGREATFASRPLELTGRELDLLARLASTPGVVCSRDLLLRQVWRSSPEWQSAKTVTEHVRRVRAKLRAAGADPDCIRAVAGIGYLFEP